MERLRLRFGLEVVLCPLPSFSFAMVQVLYKSGSAMEKEGEFGCAHFLEHMMFKGSKNFPAGSIDSFTHRNGGENNACTTRDYTLYWHLLPRNEIAKAIEMEMDRLCELNLDFSDFDSEKRVILEEIRMYRDDPQERLYDEINKKIFLKKDGYAHPVLGSISSIQKMTLQTLRSFYQRHYHQKNAVLMVLGNFDKGEVLEVIDQISLACKNENFSDLVSVPSFSMLHGKKLCNENHLIAPVPGKPLGEWNQAHFRKKSSKFSLKMDVEAEKIKIGWPCQSLFDSFEIAAELVEEVLCASRFSRLNRVLREQKKWITQVCGGAESQVRGGVFFIDLDVCKGINAEAVVTETLKIIEETARKGISKEEFESAKMRLLSSLWFDRERLEEIGFDLAQFVLLDRERDWLFWHKMVEDSKKEDVVEYLRTFLQSSLACVGVCLKKENPV